MISHRTKSLAFLLLVISASQAAQVAVSAPKLSHLEALIRKANVNNLAESPEWLKLLFYQKTSFGGFESYVDDPNYFLAKDGKVNPPHELEATIRGFFSPPHQFKNQRSHPQCQYPARLKWLSKQLKLRESELPHVICEDFKDWIARRTYTAASLVFSSYYTGNPASLFGHTFIRLHRSSESHALSDDVINFLAYPWSQNPIVYAAAGVMGYFPGRFDLIPYFMKIQEYNNLESRDLWEYPLNLNPDEIDTMVRMIWEMGPHHIDYYYFDDNCSAVLLKLIEGGKPELDLNFKHPWVLPMDTLRTVLEATYRSQEDVQFNFQPSSRNRFLSLYRQLTPQEQSIVDEMITSDQITEHLKPLSTVRQARVLDALIELIDYEEKLAASNPLKHHKHRRFDVLKARSKNNTKPVPPGSHQESERPDLSNGSSRIGAAMGVSNRDNHFYQFEWRPALTDIASSDVGYSPGLAIEFFKVRARLDAALPTEPKLHEFSLLNIQSYSDADWIIRPPSWTLSLGYMSVPSCAQGSPASADCAHTTVRSSVGFFFPIIKDRLSTGFLPLAGIGSSTEVPSAIFGEVGLSGIISLSIRPNLKLLYAHHQRLQFYSTGGKKYYPDGQVDIALTPVRNHEVRGSLTYHRRYSEGTMGYFYYW